MITIIIYIINNKSTVLGPNKIFLYIPRSPNYALSTMTKLLQILVSFWYGKHSINNLSCIEVWSIKPSRHYQ